MYVYACACIKGIAIELKDAWIPIIYPLNITICACEPSLFDSLIQLFKPTIHLYSVGQCLTIL